MPRSIPFLTLFTLLLSGAGAPVARAEGPLPADMQSGSLLFRMQEGYVTATLMNTDVAMTINGLVARISVRQEFRNEGNDWVEGVYVFPLPDRAAVDRMRLHVGDRFIEGEIREKEQAKKEYERARDQGKKASLVEQQRANLFTTSVANIAPGELVVVEIEYLEDLRFDDGTFSIRFPMTLTPRFIPGYALPDRKGSGWSPETTRVDDASLITPPMISASHAHRLSLRASVDAGVPLEIIASRYHPVNIGENGGRYDVTLAGGTVPMDQDFELLWRPVPSAAPRALAFSETIGGEPHFLLMVMPPNQADAAPVTMPRDMIFIIDTSGSMHGVSISQARRAVLQALDGLQPNDRFNIIEFNSYTKSLFNQGVTANGPNIGKAHDFVRGLQANGGTNMRPALELALGASIDETHLRQIVFITDGSVGNEEELYALIEQQLGSARLFTVGIGSAPNSWFMRKSAELGRGTFVIISALHEVQEKMDERAAMGAVGDMNTYMQFKAAQAIQDAAAGGGGGGEGGAASAGMGRDIWNDPRRFLSLQLGAGFTDEEIGIDQTTSTVGVWSLRFRHDFFGDDFEVYHDHSIVQTVSGRENTVIKTSTGVRYEITDLLYANVSLNWDHESKPAGTAEGTDTMLVVGAGMEFE